MWFHLPDFAVAWGAMNAFPFSFLNHCFLFLELISSSYFPLSVTELWVSFRSVLNSVASPLSDVFLRSYKPFREEGDGPSVLIILERNSQGGRDAYMLRGTDLTIQRESMKNSSRLQNFDSEWI
jgi:hypothetical protein